MVAIVDSKKNIEKPASHFQSEGKPKCLLWSKCAELDALRLPFLSTL